MRVTGTATSGAPTVVVYQDYQCPYCKLAETAVGPALNELAASGDVVLEYRTLTFLDSGTNTSSYRAAMAAAAADVVGHYRQYHDTVFANQPATEGTGYTDTQLRVDFARQAGISGPDLERFQRLYDTKATSDFVHSADARSQKDLAGLIGKPSTPTFTLDGKVWEGWEPWVNRDAVASAADLLKVIKADAHK
ncbi:DsbA family protein [Acidipropionibacterium timonense]|uniref:DsbA family protein n=1 Tax=Acidipropionibacterium timonense TaxID=2161818 RepID=UPI001FDA476C|nr:thioredoxin domain-containing protein [Acidipropionibacterium timonense]